MQGAQFRARVRAEPVRQEASYVLVGGQGLRRAARVAQGAQAQGLEGLVQRVGVAQGGQLGQ